MGRKKKKPIKPWCWYCNREFDDDKILAQHQRAKHFKCPFCHKKLYSGPGLTVHCVQVHKEKLDKIPEALPNRNSVDIDIYGMQGVPEDDLREHERLKRGDEGPSKSQDNRANQQSTSQRSESAHVNHQQHHNHMAVNPAAMHAAMFQHAMTIGAMPPPGFLMPPPGMPLPPPGFPMAPLPGYPTMLPPPPMNPNVPPPPQNFPFQQGMVPPPGMGGVPPPLMPFTAPPPPPPLGPEETSLISSGSGEPSSSPSASLIPPMSGVGHLLGIPPPSFTTAVGLPVSTITAKETLAPEITDVNRGEDQAKQPDQRSQENNSSQPNGDNNSSSSSATIAKPAMITTTSTDGPLSSGGKASDSFFDVPSSKARIMHPSKDLSLEELRLGLKKYQDMLKQKNFGTS